LFHCRFNCLKFGIICHKLIKLTFTETVKQVFV
jgi:hypothetical protein